MIYSGVIKRGQIFSLYTIELFYATPGRRDGAQFLDEDDIVMCLEPGDLYVKILTRFGVGYLRRDVFCANLIAVDEL